jgi:hypothetical protein
MLVTESLPTHPAGLQHAVKPQGHTHTKGKQHTLFESIPQKAVGMVTAQHITRGGVKAWGEVVT